jgi:hypothetical protein
MSTTLRKDWPSTARRVVLDAAQFFYREMNEPFPVFDVNMDRAIEWANSELDRRRAEIYEEAGDAWIDRWESGKLDDEMKKAIDVTYGRLRRAQRGLRSHAVIKVIKRTPAELDRDIAEVLASPPKRSKSPLGRNVITEEQAREMPRFEFIAHWLAVVTRKKANRGPLGLYVRRVGKRWQVVSPVGGGTVTYQATDPALLFDYARRGQLGTHIRDAEDFRVLAHQRLR